MRTHDIAGRTGRANWLCGRGIDLLRDAGPKTPRNGRTYVNEGFSTRACAAFSYPAVVNLAKCPKWSTSAADPAFAACSITAKPHNLAIHGASASLDLGRSLSQEL
jgi:hypothetical protein